ncbi:hypothetical protein [Actinocrispum wychmicini]|uniref:Calcineurin-like phosphoesterase family protein n=1 Tax=Actinocrispum wychmicini TaxID=1213861 RepID=A0A4R2JSB9_9PSEU|nr:hypothetical protein [Actinocrispum wychmicini]TCO62484.1 hypothetical protein EV192_102622 [Actinocrispum wychmicini]
MLVLAHVSDIHQDDGYLADETLDWLDSGLADAGDTSAFVCFHHPPVVLHVPYVDRIKQNGEDRLAAVLAKYSNLEMPPAIAFHVLDDDRRLATHYRVVTTA